jgi:hypothetical protein
MDRVNDLSFDGSFWRRKRQTVPVLWDVGVEAGEIGEYRLSSFPLRADGATSGSIATRRWIALQLARFGCAARNYIGYIVGPRAPQICKLRMAKLRTENARIGWAMTEDEEWLNASAALIAHTVSDPKPLADLLRRRKAIPEATVHLIAALLDPPSVNPLGVQLKIVETRNLVANPIEGSTRPQGGSDIATANESADHERWQGNAIRSAEICYEITIRLAKKYFRSLRKWIDHDI